MLVSDHKTIDSVVVFEGGGEAVSRFSSGMLLADCVEFRICIFQLYAGLLLFNQYELRGASGAYHGLFKWCLVRRTPTLL